MKVTEEKPNNWITFQLGDKKVVYLGILKGSTYLFRKAKPTGVFKNGRHLTGIEGALVKEIFAGREKTTQPAYTPNLTTAIKLASIVVHVEEFLSPDGHDYDKIAIEQLLKDPDIVEYLAVMNSAAFLPVKRNAR